MSSRRPERDEETEAHMTSELTRAVGEIGLSDYDPHALRAAVPDLADILTVSTDEFCAHLSTSSEASAEPAVDFLRIAVSMRDHWLRLALDGIDETYERRVMRIGLAHRTRAIHPRIYVLGYGRFAARLVEETMRRSTLDRDRLAELVATLLRLIFLDLTRVVHAYDVALID